MAWHEIPGFSRYEINGKREIRNKRTKQLIKKREQNGREYLTLRRDRDNKNHTLEVERLYFMATDKTVYVPIPFTGGLYSISYGGHVRSERTGRRLKPVDGRVPLSYDGTRKMFSITGLLEEVFDISAKKWAAKPVILAKGNRREYFPSILAATKFLESEVHYCWNYIRKSFDAGKKEIYGWRVNYLSELGYAETVAELNAEAKRQSRVWKIKGEVFTDEEITPRQIKEYRRVRKMTQEAFAQECGISLYHLSYYECGLRKLDPAELEKVRYKINDGTGIGVCTDEERRAQGATVSA